MTSGKTDERGLMPAVVHSENNFQQWVAIWLESWH